MHECIDLFDRNPKNVFQVDKHVDRLDYHRKGNESDFRIVSINDVRVILLCA